MDGHDNIVTVNVKWMTHLYTNLKIRLDQPLEKFKEQLWSLTGVPPERQKIMFKGIIPNNADLTTLKLTNGSKLMLIGSAEKPPECKEKIRFFEELSTQEKAQIIYDHQIVKLPPGIMNLGNTCYFNSVVQFLFPVNELWDYLTKCYESKADNSDMYFAKSLLDMKNQLNLTLDRFVPLVQIQFLRRINPTFCRKDEKTGENPSLYNKILGMYMQQDAEECLNTILNHFNTLSDEKFSDKVFGFSLVSEIKPAESEESTEDQPNESNDDNKSTVERHLVISCYMGTPLKSVGNLMDGINLSLNEEIMKFSDVKGCDVLHNKVSKLTSLPNYLIIHLVRFEWKQKSQVSHTDAIKAKVCRRVNFERYIDVTDLCTEDLKRKLRSAKSHQLSKESESDNDEKQTNLTENLDFYEISPGEYATGKYELISVVTHQGRTADAGHYINWTKDTREQHDNLSNSKKSNENSNEEGMKDSKKKKTFDTWIKFDDDAVSEHDWGTFDLCGGRSDYHIAVLLLYKSQNMTL